MKEGIIQSNADVVCDGILSNHTAPKILCVTSRMLCREEFLLQIERIAVGGAAGILLREKDLETDAYKKLAEQVIPICQMHHVPCILHGNFQIAEEIAEKLEVNALHLPLPALRVLSRKQREQFPVLGTSCHSVEDAKEAQELGCTYLIAGHIFATNCKKGLKPRGLSFLRTVCRSVNIPVWAIGGIAPDNIRAVLDAGAEGGCVMSGLMKCEDPQTLLKEFFTCSFSPPRF